MKRILSGLLLVSVVVATGAPVSARRAAYREPNPQPQRKKSSLWEQILHPHADEVNALLYEGRYLRDSIAANMQEAHQVVERKKVLADAMERFARAHKLDPDNKDLCAEYANIAFDAGEYTKAIEGYHRYVQLLGDDTPPYYVAYNLGEANARLRNFDEAADILEAAVGEMPPQPLDRTRVLALLGYVYMAQNRLDDAIDMYTRATAPSSQQYGGGVDQLALLGLIIAYDRDEQIGRAEEALEQYKQLDPQFAYMNYANYYVTGASPPSSRYYIPYSPASDKHYWIALIYEAQNRLPEAAAEWRNYIESADPIYKRRAEAHLKDVKARLVAKAKAAGKVKPAAKVPPPKPVPKPRPRPRR